MDILCFKLFPMPTTNSNHCSFKYILVNLIVFIAFFMCLFKLKRNFKVFYHKFENPNFKCKNLVLKKNRSYYKLEKSTIKLMPYSINFNFILVYSTNVT